MRRQVEGEVGAQEIPDEIDVGAEKTKLKGGKTDDDLVIELRPVSRIKLDERAKEQHVRSLSVIDALTQRLFRRQY